MHVPGEAAKKPRPIARNVRRGPQRSEDTRRVRRRYERLGYELWGHNEVIDEWVEPRADGDYIRRNPCDYLIKPLRNDLSASF